MRVLYAARLARPDLNKAVQEIAQRFTKWSELCNLKLWRLMSYIDSAKDLSLHSWCGDDPSKLVLRAYADSDLAGCPHTAKSCTGSFVALVGPNTFMPISWGSKKQTAVAHSSTEAEVGKHSVGAEAGAEVGAEVGAAVGAGPPLR